MDGKRPPPISATVCKAALWDAQQEAKAVREGIAKLSALEKAVGAKQLAAVLRLIEAVEAI